ncbi:MAG: hypothetical protein R3C45_13370 [Phycisphaerales bacterium]
MTTLNGWKAFELVTQNDTITTISDTGYGATASRGKYDGLGGFITGNTLSIFINHETDAAAISRLDVNRMDFRRAIQSAVNGGITPAPASFVTGMGYAYDRIYDGGYHAINDPAPAASGTPGVAAYGNLNFDRFCSGTLYMPDELGQGRGFIDPIYITGEEVFNDTGRFYALDPVTRNLWEAPDLGGGSWENAAQVDTGNTTHTALFLNEDNPDSPIRLYIGQKGIDANNDGEVDFLERNGLRGGTVYYFHPGGNASTIDLPDGTVTGTWSTSTVGALIEDKLEDVHTNPANGAQLVFADQTDGVYTVDLNLQFNAGTFDPNNSGATINQIVRETGAGSLGNPDNLTWAANGKLFVQQDGSGDGMWQMDADGTNRAQIAAAFSEPSGIFDASGLLGYRPGSVLLTSIQGSGSSGAQLAVMIAPDARLIADLDSDGFVGIADLNLILSSWNQTVPPGNPLADINGDGFVGIVDLNAVLGDWNAGTPPTVDVVPEPGALSVWLSIAALGYARRSR